MADGNMVWLNAELMKMDAAKNGKRLSVLLHTALKMKDGEYTGSVRQMAQDSGASEMDVRYALERLSAEDILDVDWGVETVHITFNQYYVTEEEPEAVEVL